MNSCNLFGIRPRFYRPHPKDEGRYCYHKCLSVNISGGYPHLADGRYPILPDGGYPSFPLGVPHPSQQGGGVSPSFLTGGTPFPGLDGSSTPCPNLDERYPLPRSAPPVSRMRYPLSEGTPHPDLGRGTPPPPSRSGPRTRGVPPTGTASCVLATRREVCLLRSRRRTFLLSLGCA